MAWAKRNTPGIPAADYRRQPKFLGQYLHEQSGFFYFHDHIAQVDADAKLHSAIFSQFGIAAFKRL